MPNLRRSISWSKTSKSKPFTAPAADQSSPNVPKNVNNAASTKPLEVPMVCTGPNCDRPWCDHSRRVHQSENKIEQHSLQRLQNPHKRNSQQPRKAGSPHRPYRLDLTGITHNTTYSPGTAPWNPSHSPLSTPDRLPGVEEYAEYEGNPFEDAAMRPAPLSIKSPRSAHNQKSPELPNRSPKRRQLSSKAEPRVSTVLEEVDGFLTHPAAGLGISDAGGLLAQDPNRTLVEDVEDVQDVEEATEGKSTVPVSSYEPPSPKARPFSRLRTKISRIFRRGNDEDSDSSSGSSWDNSPREEGVLERG